MLNHFDLIPCLKQPGIHIGKVCAKCEGKCPTCESVVHPYRVVHVCDDCAYGPLANRCIICGAADSRNGSSFTDAYYCYECCLLEKDRDGCPRIINVGSTRTDYYFSKKGRKA